MKKLLSLLFVVASLGWASQANVYIAQSSAGANNGSSCANAYAYTFFNSGANWGAGSTQIGAGSIVHFCGTWNITTPDLDLLAAQGSGTAGNLITILFDSTFTATSPVFHTFLDLSNRSYIKVDCNGRTIQNTANGSSLANQNYSSFIYLNHTQHSRVTNCVLSNMFVHNQGDGGSVVWGVGVLTWYSTDIEIDHNTVSNGQFCFDVPYGASSDAASLINIHDNTCSLFNIGIHVSSAGAGATLTGLNIYNNDIHDAYNWDDPADNYHHNCMHIFAVQSGASISGISVYNNHCYGDFGTTGHTTAMLFLEANPGTFTDDIYFNNVLNPTMSGGNGLIYAKSGDTPTLYNNTVIGSGHAVEAMQFDNGAIVKNNIFSTVDKFYSATSGTVTADYNLYYDPSSGSTAFNGTDFSGWQGSGHDAHGVNGASPNLTAGFVPNAGSPAISAGANLTSVGVAALNLDKAGNARPGSGAWTIGALNAANSPTVPTITTTSATSISSTSASSGGTVTSNGGASVTAQGVAYGLSANPTSPCTGSGTSSPFTTALSGLSSLTTYHYRACATNSAGTGYGADLTFTTLGANPTNPTAPQSVPSATRPTPTGSVIAVHSGDDLQTIYNASACGSDLVLDAGSTFTGNYVFNKQCTAPNWILVEGAGCNSGAVAIPTYVTQTTINAGTLFPPPGLINYATIRSTNGVAPIFTTNSSNVPAKYGYFGCFEVTGTVSQGSLVSVTNNLTETLTSQLGDHLIFDRIYPHGVAASSTVQMTRGFLVTGSNVSIVNSYVSQIYSGSDSQAILLAFGPGPYLIKNNFLSASTEVVMSGGTGKTPGYSCTVAASPAPTTTTATVNTCIDAASGSVSTPVVGTSVMFLTSGSSPTYVAKNWTTITANATGALTFTAIPSAPVTGAAKVLWGIVPADVTVTKNYFYKLPSWNPSDPSYDGVTRSSKNFLESKYGKRWAITANAFVNSWDNGQADAFNFNSTDQNGDCPWCVSSDINLSNNVIKNIAGDFGLIASQDFSGNCPGALARVLISNNLFWVPGGSSFIASGGKVFSLAGNSGTCGIAGGGADSVQILHNHLLGAGINMKLASALPYNFTNLLIRDNITERDQYGWTNQCPDGTPPNVDGTACMTGDVTTSGTYTASNNAIINSGIINGGQGISDATITSRYSSMVLPNYYDTSIATNYSGAPFLNYSAIGADYHNWALTGAGPWRNAASDGTDPGVNFTTLDAALFGAPTITTSTPLPNGSLGVPYSLQFAANGSTPISWFAGTGLPVWATLSSTGLLSGTPSSAATSIIPITATNANGSDGPKNFTLTIVGPPIPVITSPLVAPGTQGTAFSYQITASGSPTTFGASGLPNGLTVATFNGVISGTPTVSGTFSALITATNAGGTGTATLVISLASPPPPPPVAPVITSSLTGSTTQSSPYTYQITATNTPTSYGASGLATGLSINTSTGLISGTPSVSGTFHVNISATNAGGTGAAVLTLVIASPPPPAPVITSALTGTATNGSPYSYLITATNTPTSYGASSLPTGVSVNTSTGQISGTPSVSGNFNINISATNAGGTGTAVLALAISSPPPPPPPPSPPVITSALTATTPQGASYSYQITATNTPTGYGASGLPTGLTVSTSTGIISGMPTGAGSFSVTISAINAGGTGTATLALTVSPPPPPPAPAITSSLSASGMIGTAFTYQITASNTPTGFGASNLPTGLFVTTSTGVISGTPTVFGNFSVSISATNAGGTGSGVLALTILGAPPPPPPPTLTCDLNHDTVVNILDVQLMTNQVLGLAACTNNLTQSGSCNNTDIQRVITAAQGGACKIGP